MAKTVYIEGAWIPDNRTGIGRYGREITRALLERHPSEIDYRIFALDPFGRGSAVSQRELLAEYRPIPWISKRAYYALMKRAFVPSIDRFLAEKPDVMWFVDYVVPPVRRPVKVMTTLYDLGYLKFPQFVHPGTRNFLTRFVPAALERADHVLTISENSRKEIGETYGIAESKISVANPAHDPEIFYPRSGEAMEQVKSRFGIENPFILFAGTLEPRKNVEGLVEAYAHLPESLRKAYSLVLAGGKGWLDEGIQKVLSRYSDLDIHPLGFVPDPELACLYSAASLFVYPSFYEGFGIPPLEAMACGAPVLVSDNSALGEVVGDAARKLPRLTVPEISRNIEEMLVQSSLRTELSEKGRIRSERFSWKKSAQKVESILSQML